MNGEMKRAGGFTLIELMIVVAVVAILAAIAYPSYQNHILKTRRVAAAACLNEMAQFMERHYTTHLTYVGAALPQTQCRNELASHYTIQPAGAATASAYTIQAIPQGGQDRDKCATLSLDQAGTKGTTGTGVTGSDCW